MPLTAALATVITLLGRPDGCPPLPDKPPVVIRTEGGIAKITFEPAPPPSCFNRAVITWTDREGSREILRFGDESMTTASAFQAEGLDLIFLSSRQLSASTEWTYSQILWLHSQGELMTIKLEPNSACRGYELPQLDEPTAYGGYSLDNGVVRFSATYSPNKPEMTDVSASLKVVKFDGGYVLRVASCKVERPR